jgi:PPP family 3-phenylpropionic acid transporter
MAFRLSFFYAAVFLTVGVMLPFWPVWLKSRGLSPAEIGLLLSAGMWIRAFTNPVIAQIADRRGQLKGMLVVLAWGALLTHALFFLPGGFWVLLLLSVPSTMMFTAVIPIGDAVTMLKVREGTLDYGRVRLWGSLTFIVAATGGGYMLKDQPEQLILWMVIGALLLLVVSCHLVPATRTAGARRFSAPFAAILKNRNLVIFLAAAALIQASHAVYYGFATLHWQSEGIDADIIGMLWAEGVVAEIILFIYAGKLVDRLGPVLFLGLAAIAGIIRWSVLGSTSELTALIAVQGFHAFTFGAAHVAVMHFIAREVAAEYTATAQSLYSSFAVGTSMAAAMMAAGWLYDRYEGTAFFAMAALALVGGLMLTGLRVRPNSTNPAQT